MPTTYRSKGQKPTPEQKAQTKQLSKLPLPPPRPKKTRSSRSITTDCGTVASGTTYTSRVSKVSIKPREPVLESNDPLSRAMQDKIQDSKEAGERVGYQKGGTYQTNRTASVIPNPEHTRKSSKQHHGFAPLPEEDPDDAIALEEGIPTSVVSAPTQKGPVVLPPPPPLDSLETYSLGTNDFISKYNPHQQSSCRNWRLIICVASILLLGVIAGAVATVVVVLNNNKEQQ